MRRIAIIIALLATAACSAAPTAPDPTARFEGGLVGSGGGRADSDSGGGTLGSGTESDGGGTIGSGTESDDGGGTIGSGTESEDGRGLIGSGT